MPSVWTFRLRRGMKWSDGEPFTTEDVRFWFEDDASNRELNPNVFENLVQKGRHLGAAEHHRRVHLPVRVRFPLSDG